MTPSRLVSLSHAAPPLARQPKLPYSVAAVEGNDVLFGKDDAVAEQLNTSLASITKVRARRAPSRCIRSQRRSSRPLHRSSRPLHPRRGRRSLQLLPGVPCRSLAVGSLWAVLMRIGGAEQEAVEAAVSAKSQPALALRLLNVFLATAELGTGESTCVLARAVCVCVDVCVRVSLSLSLSASLCVSVSLLCGSVRRSGSPSLALSLSLLALCPCVFASLCVMPHALWR